MATLEELRHRFKFHPATDQTRPVHIYVRELMSQTAERLHAVLPEGRETALVWTHMEEAMMWANAAIARSQDERRPGAGG